MMYSGAMTMHNQIAAGVRAKLDSYDPQARAQLMALRQLILDVAAATHGVGPLEETLRWGQISYLTTVSKSGSLVRMDTVPQQPQQLALFFHCQTNLVESFRMLYGDLFDFDGQRMIAFDLNDGPMREALHHCLTLAFTYHQRKKAPAQA
jgi:hypothetical protein